MSVQTASTPKKVFEFPDLLGIICALVIIVAFLFMPWLGVPDREAFSFSFFKLPDFLFEGNPLFRVGIPGVALVPIAAIFALVVAGRGAATENPTRYKAIGFVIAGVLVLVFFNGFFIQLLMQQLQVNGQLVSDGAVYGYGFWVTLLAGVALLFQLFRLLEGLRGKLVIGFTLVFTLVFALAYFWFYQFASQAAYQRLVDDINGTLDGLVAGVDGDAVAGLMQDVERTPDVYPTDQRYWDHVNWLGTVRQIETRAITYSYAYADENRDSIIWVGSVGATFDPPVGVQFKEEQTLCATCRTDDNLAVLASQQRQAAPSEVYSDEYGSWITSNAPFFDSAGNLVGAVGLDIEASSVLSVQQSILNSILLSFELAYLVLFSLVYLVAGALTDPIRKLASAAKLVGEGHYEKANLEDIKPSAGWRDEIDSLRAVFVDMAQKIYKREENLKQQVKELKIEIDQVKAKQQIKEIVETEFFESIASKAKDIRARAPRSGSTDTPT
jgi:hypothetical protein